jgi:2,3-bisphosphoglycerate-independent phosphoglycerate mutase
MKYIVVILDGAAGWQLDELQGNTTLQAAVTPLLDLMATQGEVGLAATVPPGLEPSSSAACTSILGFDPVAHYVGRGAIEAAAMGINLQPDEVALRVNTLTIVDGIMRSYAGGHIPTAQSRAIVERLAQNLNDETFTLHPGVAYRHILVVKGHPELLEGIYTSPHDISDKPVADFMVQGDAAPLLAPFTQRAHELLETDPTNEQRIAAGELPITDLWPFWPGTAPQDMPTFEKTYQKCATLTSGVDLLFGLAQLFSIDPLPIAGVTDGSDTDYVAQVTGALESLDTHDVVVIHVESPDEMGHAGDVRGKIEAIEAIDQHIMSRIHSYARQCEKNGEGVRVLAMPDHPTPIALKTHVRESVPYLLWGTGIVADEATTYDEISARDTGRILDPGYRVMQELLRS